jgi:solute carrier family 25 (adenine nucleotide translocator) protein 4/5/6/31
VDQDGLTNIVSRVRREVQLPPTSTGGGQHAVPWSEMKAANNDTSNTSSPNSPLRSLVAGAAAGAFSKTVTAPIERVKLLLQLSPSNETSVRQVVKHVYQQEGLLAFWRGNTPSVLQKSANSALNFMLMDWFKQVNTTIMTTLYGPSYQQSRSTQVVNSLVSGGLSGATTTTLLYPLEFLRTRLAVDINKGDGRRQFRGMRDVIVYTYKTDGIRGVYKGYGTSIFYVAMHRVVYLGGFDVAKTEMLHCKHATTLDMAERVVIAQGVSLLAAAVCYPLDTVRRQLMMQAGKSDKQFTTTWACARSIYANQGVKGFFKGLGPQLAKTVGGALLLVAYDSFRGVMK